MNELLDQFLIEGRELTQQVGADLMALEAQPHDAELLDSAFRAIHTLKGSAGLFDLAPLGHLLHAAEDVMGEVRAGRLSAARDVIDSLLQAVGLTERWLSAIEADGGLPPDASEVAPRCVGRLRSHLGAASADATNLPAHGGTASWIAALLASQPLNAQPAGGVLAAIRYTPDPDCYFRGEDPLAVVKSTPGIVALRIGQREGASDTAGYDPYHCDLQFELISAAPLDEVRAAYRLVGEQAEILAFLPEADTASTTPAGRSAYGTGRTLRVDAARVDALAEIVDDLVILKNALADLAGEAAGALDTRAVAEALAGRQAALDRLVGRLSRTVTGIRLLPVMPLLRRFPPMVREIGASLGKEVDLVIEGEGVEADKAIVDGLFDPLTHLIRNALDHGVEPAEERRRGGKPQRARLSIAARRQGERLLLEIRDDGRGIDPAALRRVAVSRGVASEAEVASMSDAEALDLVFRPGFSTAERVTNLSGRGVGMDAVRASIARLGGRVTLASEPGRGATVRLDLPLSVVLTRVLVVSCDGELYGVPVAAVVETARVNVGHVVPIRAGRAVILRDRPVPLLSLKRLLSRGELSSNGERLDNGELLGDDHVVQAMPELRVLVLRIGAERVALAVDTILEPRDLTLRPLTGLLSGMRGVSGTAVLGNGQVLLVLDVGELIG